MGAFKGSVVSRKPGSRWPENLGRLLSWKALPVLVAISLLASLAVFVFPSTASAEHEGEETSGFLPIETQLYFTVNLDPGEDQLNKFSTILNYWWQDPNVEKAWDDLMDGVEEESTFNIEDDILPWIGPELAVGARNFTVEPEIIAFIGTMDKNASDTFINDKFLPEVTEQTGTPGDYEGIETLYFIGDGPYCAFTDEYIIVSSHQTFLEDTLDIINDGSLTSLADDDNFKQARAALPDRVGMLYYNIEAFIDEIAQEAEFNIDGLIPPYFASSIKFEGAGMTGTGYYPIPEAITFPSTQSKLLETARIIPGNALFVASVDESACWTAASTYMQVLWQKFTEVTTGELSEMTDDIEAAWEGEIAPLLGELAEMNLVEAVNYLDTTYELDLEAGWENIRADMGDLSGMTFPEALDYLNDDLGLGDIWGDLALHLGEASSKSFGDALAYLGEVMPDLLLMSETAVALLPASSFAELFGEQDVMFITEVKDVAVVQGYLDLVTGIMGSIGGIQVSTQKVAGVDATIIGDGGTDEVGYIFLEVDGTDYLVVGSTDILEAAVEVRDHPEKSLSEAEEYEGLSFQLGEIRGSFIYFDITGMLKQEALSDLEFGTSFDEQISDIFYYVPLKSAIGFTNPILGEDGITMNASFFLLPPPLVDIEIDEGFLGSFLIPESTFDLSSVNSNLGEAAVEIDVEIIDGAPAGSRFQVVAITDPDAKILEGFDDAAGDAGFSIEGIGYVIRVDKEEITGDDIGTATITLKVGKEWADEYGVENIRIIRIGDDGTKEVLPTEFIEYDEDQAVFKGISENGLSHFGLVAIDEGGSGTNWALIGGIIGAVVVVLAVAMVVLLRRRPQKASSSW